MKAKFNLRAYRNKFSIVPSFYTSKLMWKDKFASPRCEIIPHFEFQWLWFGLYGSWGDYHYWEQWLWTHKYCDGDIKRAKETWGWVDMETNESTWVDYGKKSSRNN